MFYHRNEYHTEVFNQYLKMPGESGTTYSKFGQKTNLMLHLYTQEHISQVWDQNKDIIMVWRDSESLYPMLSFWKEKSLHFVLPQEKPQTDGL